MKSITAIGTTIKDMLKAPKFIKFTALIVISLTILFFANRFSTSPFSYSTLLGSFSELNTTSPPLPPPSNPPSLPPLSTPPSNPPSLPPISTPPSNPPSIPPLTELKTAPPPPPSHPSRPKLKIKRPPLPKSVLRIGIIDDNGVMSDLFESRDFDWDSDDGEELRNLTKNAPKTEEKQSVRSKTRVAKYTRCHDNGKRDYVPCLDNKEEIEKFKSSDRGEKYERHCPSKPLDCLVPPPKGYKTPIPWPKSRDEVWFTNVPHTRLVEDKGGQNWISVKDDKLIFPGGGTQFIHGADEYLNQISKMVPDIAFGQHTRVVLDIGCGVASFGAFLFSRNVTTMSIAPKDVHENQIQFALERGVSAMGAVFATHRLLYPSQAFDLIHCSRCRINWTRDDGILLLEANRMLRAGGYFVWAAQPVYKHEENLQEQWKEMLDLTARICWELVKKEGYIAIWQKPLNNSCYINRDAEAQPPLCPLDNDPDDVWYVGLKPCITRLPENGYGANVTAWPARLHDTPNRLKTIKLDASISRKEIFKAESKYWSEIITGYVDAFRWRGFNLRNVLDMRAGFGGFAEALHNLQVDCWVMNVVPISGFNTLPVIYDRGLIGVMHDWCEPFDTYPRTYDLIHAAGLFPIEQKRCNISTIMLEMDRMLRFGGHVYIRDSVTVMDEIKELGDAIGWVTDLRDTGEGPHASWRVLICEKRF